jgi:hypothetical protein
VPPAVVLDLLDGVAERVAVVQELPGALLGEVVADDLRLDGDGPLDQLAGVRAGGAARRLGVGLDQLEDPGVVREADLHHLRQTAT